MALETSAEHPVPLRVVSQHVGAWIHRLGYVWVEGQVTQLTRRPGARTTFLVLRDPAARVSMQVTCPTELVVGTSPAVAEGDRVVVHATPSWYFERGTLSLAADDLRPVGIGALLARIEQLRRLLAAEGLFDPERKRRPPFIPSRIGLVCGRASAAEHDVVQNARLRAPGVPFQIENVPVQGSSAVPEIVDALRRLDADTSVDVIILARGGGSAEDLLPFSDEALVRAVADCRTTVVAAIGHETDTPLVDLVADVRASTPTDAAKRVVPDVAQEARHVQDARRRLADRVGLMLTHERARLEALRVRPVLREPVDALVEPRSSWLAQARRDSSRAVSGTLVRENLQLDHARAQVQALSPAATLSRGYAVVQHLDGRVVRRPGDAAAGDTLRLRLSEGELGAVVASSVVAAVE